MAAKQGNKTAQKHSKEHVIAVLEDCAEGMLSYSTTKHKTQTQTSQTENTEHVGYSCLERAMMANGHTRRKLNEWAKTWGKDEDVSDKIKKVREIADEMLIVNTTEGRIPLAFGVFLCKSRLGMVEKGVQMEVEKDTPLVKVASVKPDGTRVEQ